MKTVRIKNVVIGEGMPKICTPIVGKTKEEIIEEATSFKEMHADIAEWRADWFEDVFDMERVKDVLKDLVPALNNIPLLFTFRTSKEGGEKEIDANKYSELIKFIVATRLVDLIDVEAFMGDEIVHDIIKNAHDFAVKVVGSYHDFEKTPSKDEIICRLKKMQELGADIAKIAVMPKCRMDVLELLEATAIMSEKYADRPITTISMSGMGVVSRLAGEIFGSALTFGAAKKASAPGQIPAVDLQKTMEILHNNL